MHMDVGQAKGIGFGEVSKSFVQEPLYVEQFYHLRLPSLDGALSDSCARTVYLSDSFPSQDEQNAFCDNIYRSCYF